MATSFAAPANLATPKVIADHRRRWLWWFLAIIGAGQLYFVRELLAALVIFALGFAAIAFVVVSLYMLHHSWALAVTRLAELRQPVMNMAPASSQNQKAA